MDVEKDYPKYEVIIRREQRLKELEKEIETEQDHERRTFMLETYLELSKLNNERLLTFTAEKLQEYEKLIDKAVKLSDSFDKKCQELANKIEEERQEHEEFYYNFCGLMVNKPRVGFEIILKHIERNEKIIDQSGEGWQWTLKFPLISRLRMAARLLFGTKDLNIDMEKN